MKNEVDVIFEIIAATHGLSKSSTITFKKLMTLLDDKGLIYLNACHKQDISSENGFALQTIRNCLQSLKKAGLIKSVGVGTFKPSKSIFVDDYFYGLYARTAWKDINYELKLNSKIGVIQVVGAI